MTAQKSGPAHAADSPDMNTGEIPANLSTDELFALARNCASSDHLGQMGL